MAKTTKLAICRKCHKVFFSDLSEKHPHLTCPQRKCRSRNIALWSTKLINKLGYKLLYNIFPRDIDPRALDELLEGIELIDYRYCNHAHTCLNPEKQLGSHCCIKWNKFDNCFIPPDKSKKPKGRPPEKETKPEIEEAPPEIEIKLELKHTYCYYADYCSDPRKDLKDDTKSCSNQDRKSCLEKAKKKFYSKKAKEKQAYSWHTG